MPREACKLRLRHSRNGLDTHSGSPYELDSRLADASVAFVAACGLWTGTLLSVSWLTGRARMMADGQRSGASLSRCSVGGRSLLVASVVAGFVSLVGVRPIRAHWVYGIVGAMVCEHRAPRRRRLARQARRAGSVRASEGEAIRRVALVLSFGAILALAALRTSLVP
jgi:hypothetical protein